VLDHPADATVWQLLAQAQAARGLPLRALRAEAEARVAVLDYSAAMDRLRAAQDLARRGTTDHIEASIIDARARQVALLLREQAAER
jgi:predicted Zn-dependent protease